MKEREILPAGSPRTEEEEAYASLHPLEARSVSAYLRFASENRFHLCRPWALHLRSCCRVSAPDSEDETELQVLLLIYKSHLAQNLYKLCSLLEQEEVSLCASLSVLKEKKKKKSETNVVVEKKKRSRRKMRRCSFLSDALP